MSIDIFLSYCWKDEEYADTIEQYYKSSEIIIHRDKKDISYWENIKDFMKSIRNSDFAILIVSDNYLKSDNCMYEALQVMKEKEYSTKIFPLVINHCIYGRDASIAYIKYWQDEFDSLSLKRQGIQNENASEIDTRLKRLREISLHIGEFIETVANMNNPLAKDILEAINITLQKRGFYSTQNTHNSNSQINYFEKIGISNFVMKKRFTDKDKKDFLRKSYSIIIDNIKKLAQQFSIYNAGYDIEIEEISNNENSIYVYHDGNIKSRFRVFMGSSFGEHTIAVSPSMTHGDRSTCEKLYVIEIAENEMFFQGIMSHLSGFNNNDPMDCNAITREIWEDLIQSRL